MKAISFIVVVAIALFGVMRLDDPCKRYEEDDWR